MKEFVEGLEKFQKTFKGSCNTEPCNLKQDEYKLRYKLLKEENEEYLEACEQDDLVEVLDALTDQLFLVVGNFVSHGMQHLIEPAFKEVLRSNMSKTDENGNAIINGENGVYDATRPLGKVLKSDRYSEPKLKGLLSNVKSYRIINLVMEQDGLKTKLSTETKDYEVAQIRTRIEEINRELEELTGKSL